DRGNDAVADGRPPLKIMYRVDGSSGLTEETLDHFEGWRGSAPVRIGNGAADQLQLDIYGEAMDAIYLSDACGLQAGYQGWTKLEPEGGRVHPALPDRSAGLLAAAHAAAGIHRPA